ncbi:MAG: hypothetical protein LBB56_03995 [Chitinispirillales bacterium]|jgi:hypothetical protein|nr:hypothetical protein [Chitinispirillales bacterium]
MEFVNTPESMRFRDYVKKLPHQWILDNLICGGDKTRRILSSAMIEEAVLKFSREDSLIRRFEELPDSIKLKCSQVYLMGGNGLAPPAENDFFNDPLLSSLLVFAAQNRANTRYFGFDEFEPILRPLMAKTLVQKGLTAKANAKNAAVCPWRPLNDVSAVCSMVFHNILKRSRYGGISRAGLNQLKHLVHDATLTGKGKADEKEYHPAGFLIGYCQKETFIAAVESGYVLNLPLFKAWLKKSVKARMSGIMDYAYTFCGHFRFALLTEMLSVCGTSPLSVKLIVDEQDMETLLQALKVFDFLGYLNLEESDGGLFFTPCRFTNEEDPDKLLSNQKTASIVIMPDFSVVIPQEVSPEELFDYANIGILKTFDKIYKGQINRHSVCNALSRGVDDKDIRHWLLNRASPANVLSTVEEWCREFSRLYVCHDTILVSSNEKVTLQLSACEQLREHLTPVSAHKVFRIRSGSEQKIFDILEKLGFDPRTPDEQPAIIFNVENQTAAPAENHWKPLTDFSSSAGGVSERTLTMRRTKYGSELKALDISEMTHVIDYAILTAQQIIIDYEGSSLIKQNIYTVLPLSMQKGAEPVIEAQIPHSKTRKMFFLRKVKRIGVVQ